MMQTLTAHLIEDHRRLESLFAEAYEPFRAGLLRHIAIEEKLLFPVLPRTRTARLREEHARIAALLAVSPTVERRAQLEAMLHAHDAAEEDPGGVYAACEAALGADASIALAARARAFPAVRVAAYRDVDRSWKRSP